MKKILDSNMIKFIVIIAMTIDHIAWNEPNGEGCIESDSNNFEEDNCTKPIYVEKQRKGDHHGY